MALFGTKGDSEHFGRNKFTILGKTLKEIQQSGLFGDAGFSKQIQNDIEAIDKYVNILKSGKAAKEDLAKAMEGASAQAQLYVKQTDQAVISGQNFAATQTLGAKALNGLKNAAVSAAAALATMAVNLVISFAIQKAVEIIYNLVTYSDRLIDKSDELRTEYQQVQGEVDALNQELETTNARIDELNGKDSLTIVEEEELAKLRGTNEELERQLQIKKLLAQEEGKKAENAAAKVVNDKSETDFLVNGNGEIYGQTKVTRSDKIKSNIEKLKEYDEQIKQLEKDFAEAASNDYTTGFYKDASGYENRIQNLKDAKENLYTETVDLQAELENERDSFIGATDAGDEALNMINESADALIEYEEGADGLKAKNWDELLGSDAFTTVEDRLKELAENEELTTDALSDPEFSDFVDGLDDIGMSTEEAVERLNELYGAEQQVGDVDNTNAGSVTDFANSLAELGDTSTDTGAKVAALSNAYKEMASSGYLSCNSIAALLTYYPDLISYMETENGVTKISKSLLEDKFNNCMSSKQIRL